MRRLFARARWVRLGTLATLIALLGLLAPTTAGAQATATIQPGVSIVNESGSQCTTNWVYDGTGAHAGEVFIGTAAHCVDNVGEAIAMQDATFGSSTLTIGEVAFISPNLDYSFIRVAEENLGSVSPAMKGHPDIPTGVSTTETAGFGDLVQFSGHGVGFHLTTLTQEERVGVLHFMDETDWSAAGPVISGDSGGPVGNLTDDNKALGVVDVICVGTSCAGAGGVTVQGLLADSASLGFTVQLRTI
jgi:hypothetical protein